VAARTNKLTRRLQLFIAALVSGLIVGILTYIWCYTLGSCSGDCIVVGYSVSAVCLTTAIKAFLGTFLAVLVAVYVFRRSA